MQALDRDVYKTTAEVELQIPPGPQEETQVHKTLVSGLPRKVGRCGAGDECWAACSMPPFCLLLLLLLLAGATAALRLEGGHASRASASGVSSPWLGRMPAHLSPCLA